MNFRETDAPRSDFSFSHLRDSDFTGADLRGCKFEGARLDWADVAPIDENEQALRDEYDLGEKEGYNCGYDEGKADGESEIRAEMDLIGSALDELRAAAVGILDVLAADGAEIPADTMKRLQDAVDASMEY